MKTMTAPSPLLKTHIESRGYECHGDVHTHSECGLEKNRRLLIRAQTSVGPITLQLEVVRWDDGDVSGWLGNVSNAFNDNDTSYDNIDSIGVTPDQAMYSLVSQLPQFCGG